MPSSLTEPYFQRAQCAISTTGPSTHMPKKKRMQRMGNRTPLSERTRFIAELVKMLQDMIPEGQGEGFDAAKWVGRWLKTPQPALAGAAPKDYLDTAEGRTIVKRLLGTIESGAYV